MDPAVGFISLTFSPLKIPDKNHVFWNLQEEVSYQEPNIGKPIPFHPMFGVLEKRLVQK